ncbi:hypothetical protein, partial [Aliidongia dinghuensis]|uniref:hypothetical protein n=1 Tax=Aliidongia dinghuensis TaxID=1867774 RepID=UPI001E3A62E9
RRATTHSDTPRSDGDFPWPDEIEVTDRRHPLYGRRFRLLAIRGSRGERFAHIEYRPDISLILPITVTSLQAAATSILATKLSFEALQDLVLIASEHEEECRSTPATSGDACLNLCATRSSKTSRSSCGR